MKTVYLVRHGESEDNIGPVRRGDISPLTTKGRSQALFLAQRCLKLPIEVIISSPSTRSSQTAEIINERINKPLELCSLFAEARRPKEQVGARKDDPLALRAAKMMRQHFAVVGFRFSDEENLEDIKKRTGKMLQFLQGRSENNILVITHGFIMKSITAAVVYGDNFSADDCLKFVDALLMENTGISALTFNENQKWWRLWIWNDHSHLA